LITAAAEQVIRGAWQRIRERLEPIESGS
jgi:hypothetical protein